MDDLIRVSRYVGESNVPQDVKRRRRQVHDVMRRMGSPIIIKRMYTDYEVGTGEAEESPNFEDPYGNVRQNDHLSWGVGFVSTLKSDNEWIGPDGVIVVADDSPGEDYVEAPKYRGYGEGYLTYIIEPDAAFDFFKLTPGGAMLQVQTATAQAAWYPEIRDNSLIINVELDAQGKVVGTRERYLAKMVSPVAMRGKDRRGKREYTEDGGNRFVVNQAFSMDLLPLTHVLYSVETDR